MREEGPKYIGCSIESKTHFELSNTFNTFQCDNRLRQDTNKLSPLPVLVWAANRACLLYTSPSPQDLSTSRMPSSA